MGAFGAVTIGVTAFVVRFRNSDIENPLSFFDLRADLGQVGDLQWRAILLDDFHQVDAVEMELIINHLEAFLWKVEGLFNQVAVRVLHHDFLFRLLRSGLFLADPASSDSLIHAKVSNLLFFASYELKFPPVNENQENPDYRSQVGDRGGHPRCQH
ncbi:MAG: hypothetical protein ACKO7B_19055, partial [Flavobacteriales bacterium]